MASKKSRPAWYVKKYANFQFCQFFVVLHKIGHECIMTLHGHFTKITKKTKHGNVYNDRSTLKNGNQKTRFFGSHSPGLGWMFDPELVEVQPAPAQHAHGHGQYQNTGPCHTGTAPVYYKYRHVSPHSM